MQQIHNNLSLKVKHGRLQNKKWRKMEQDYRNRQTTTITFPKQRTVNRGDDYDDDQCDQIGIFLKSMDNKYIYKIGKNI